ncbi:hypothetical protein [Sphingobium bisphenolivorans]|nr:hypothetical protein [Sphingobium bisphenolivorans]
MPKDQENSPAPDKEESRTEDEKVTQATEKGQPRKVNPLAPPINNQAGS